jgi:hypothetical protein
MDREMVRIPWYVWTSLLAVTCILVGGYWDISWHMSIGRDSFWTPAHLLIQAGGITAGLAGTYLIVTTTLRPNAPLRDASIRVWGFRGPLGAFLGVWGAATMVVSAPFDNWWHAAYGLDVKILSPPHVVLQLGVLAVAMGSLLLVARERMRWALLVIGGEILMLMMTALLETTFRANLHRADAYRSVAIVAPAVILAVAHGSGARRGATVIAAIYTAIMLLGVWICPLVPAEPKLGPVYQPITHLVPLGFPLLVIVGAYAMDLVRERTASWRRAARAPLIGVAFLVAFVAVEWPFASFLSSDASHNWLFGTHHHPYFARPEWHETRGTFLPTDDASLVWGMAQAWWAAMLSAWLGLWLGDALAKVRR